MRHRRSRKGFLGGYAEGVTPVPIPNTEVKPLRADGTAWVTVWESRSPPGFKYKRPASHKERRGVLRYAGKYEIIKHVWIVMQVTTIKVPLLDYYVNLLRR